MTPVTEVVAATKSIDGADTADRRFEQQPQAAAADRVDPGEAPPPANDAGQSEESATATPPSSYGIAQFLNTEPSERSSAAETRDDDGLAQFRTQPSQEGRAA